MVGRRDIVTIRGYSLGKSRIQQWKDRLFHAGINCIQVVRRVPPVLFPESSAKENSGRVVQFLGHPARGLRGLG